MKSITGIVFLMFLLISKLVVSQSLLGVYAGYNKSKFYDSFDSNPHQGVSYEPYDTYCFGISYKERKDQLLNLTLNLDCLKRELDYRYYNGGQAGSTTIDILVDFYTLNLKILPEVRLGNKIGFYFNLGPYVGGIVKSKKKGTGSSWLMLETREWEESGSASEEFGDLDLGFSSSLGIEVPIFKALFISADINYSVGLTDISAGYRLNSKNYFSTLGVLYKFSEFRLTDIL